MSDELWQKQLYKDTGSHKLQLPNNTNFVPLQMFRSYITRINAINIQSPINVHDLNCGWVSRQSLFVLMTAIDDVGHNVP